MDSSVLLLIICCFAMLLSVQFLLREQGKRLNALTRVESKLDFLLARSGFEYDPLANVPEDVVNAIRTGNKILAIKHYREATGASLADAKHFVESVQARLGSS